MTHLVGYARVSSTGQSLEVQRGKLSRYGCDKFFEEKKSGTTANRPQLKECLGYLREGDTLVITKLDRLARSTEDLIRIVNDLGKRGINFTVLDQAIDTSTPTGKLLFHVLASIAEFETEIRKERQAEGIAKAKSVGTKFGRPNKLSADALAQLRQDRQQGVPIGELIDRYGISRASIYRVLEA